MVEQLNPLLGAFGQRPNNEDIDEVYPRLFQSGYAAARNLIILKALGITHILTVCPYAKPQCPTVFKYLVLDEIEDDDRQDILKLLPIGLDFIRQALTENDTNKVLVHCAAGISRSGAFCVAYMIEQKQWTLVEAMNFAQKKRPKLYPNSNF